MAAPDGYERGPDATVRAAESALAELEDARGVVLVEGVSDQIAVEATARALGLDLGGVVVIPIGGAHAVARTLSRLNDRLPTTARVAVLCDDGEASHVARSLASAEATPVACFVCRLDLEDELIRAAGTARITDLVAAEGDTNSFARMSAQPAWRGAPHDVRFRRFVGAGAGRKHRYAAAIVAALEPDEIPTPLVAAVRHVTG